MSYNTADCRDNPSPMKPLKLILSHLLLNIMKEPVMKKLIYFIGIRYIQSTFLTKECHGPEPHEILI